MTSIRIIIVFFIFLLLDVLILPALSGSYYNLMTPMFLICIILAMGPGYDTLFYILGFGLIYEMFAGYSLGLATLPFLLLILFLFIAGKFISLDIFHRKPEIGNRFFVPAMGTIFFLVVMALIEFGGFIVGEAGSLNFSWENYFNIGFIAYVYIFILIIYAFVLKLINYGFQKRLQGFN